MGCTVGILRCKTMAMSLSPEVAGLSSTMRLPLLARSRLSWLWVVLLLSACNGAPTPERAATAAAPAPVLEGEDARDVHSFAEPFVARVTHVDLDLRADFTARTLSGTATLQVQSQV